MLPAQLGNRNAGLLLLQICSSVNRDRFIRPSLQWAELWLHVDEVSGVTSLATHKFIVIPSVVTASAWNLIFSPVAAAGAYTQFHFHPFSLDPRLNPP